MGHLSPYQGHFRNLLPLRFMASSIFTFLVQIYLCIFTTGLPRLLLSSLNIWIAKYSWIFNVFLNTYHLFASSSFSPTNAQGVLKGNVVPVRICTDNPICTYVAVLSAGALILSNTRKWVNLEARRLKDPCFFAIIHLKSYWLFANLCRYQFWLVGNVLSHCELLCSYQ